KDISVILRLRDIPADLCFDADQVEQVLLNLLDNACRFTPKHGLIEIAGYPFFCERRTHHTPLYAVERRVCQNREPNSFRVDIKDSGPPVPAESIPLIFEEYIPYSSPDDRSGGGLGLAVCKLIVRSHQGQIWVRSGPDAVVFSFSRPLPQRVADGGGLRPASLRYPRSRPVVCVVCRMAQRLAGDSQTHSGRSRVVFQNAAAGAGESSGRNRRCVPPRCQMSTGRTLVA